MFDSKLCYLKERGRSYLGYKRVMTWARVCVSVSEVDGMVVFVFYLKRPNFLMATKRKIDRAYHVTLLS